ncbi:MAG: type II toxin-antitoxin system RelE/ParE family toxin [Gammaproteobacteria bacterium]
MTTITFFRLNSGECPVEDFLDSLSSREAQKVIWVMQLIEDLEKIPTQYFKKLVNTADIWEIRIQLGSDIFRILGFFKTKAEFLATNGFRKKTQKTPSKEIILAEKRKVLYLNRERDSL